MQTSLKPTTLMIPPDVRRRLSDWAVEEYPSEACGLLLGKVADRGPEVSQATRARNIERERKGDRYVLAPEDFVAAWQKADALGLEILGIWHSHPDRPAEPSRMDVQGAWNGYAYLILSVTSEGVSDLRSWRLEEATA